jgi:hypothetical protein
MEKRERQGSRMGNNVSMTGERAPSLVNGQEHTLRSVGLRIYDSAC